MIRVNFGATLPEELGLEITVEDQKEEGLAMVI